MQREKRTEIITLRVTPRDKETHPGNVRRSRWPDRHRLPVLLRTGQGDRAGGRVWTQVLSELKAQGRNLNQLTTLANMGKVTVVIR